MARATPESYTFVVRHNGTRRETLGGFAFDREEDAVAYGRRLILELLKTDRRHYAACTMDISRGERAVVSVPFGGT